MGMMRKCSILFWLHFAWRVQAYRNFAKILDQYFGHIVSILISYANIGGNPWGALWQVKHASPINIKLSHHQYVHVVLQTSNNVLHNWSYMVTTSPWNNSRCRLPQHGVTLISSQILIPIWGWEMLVYLTWPIHKVWSAFSSNVHVMQYNDIKEKVIIYKQVQKILGGYWK
jgi:hypothetical protein